MSAFGGKADMTIWACLLLRSLLGVKRTWVGALHMSAFDPKRTSGGRYALGPNRLTLRGPLHHRRSPFLAFATCRSPVEWEQIESEVHSSM